jgi:hypothetical protein
MTITRALALSCAVLLYAGAVMAQPSSADAASGVPGGKTAPDCSKAMARHDHGAERGTPNARSAPCAAAPASAAKSKAKVRRHDHARFHKNQG